MKNIGRKGLAVVKFAGRCATGDELPLVDPSVIKPRTRPRVVLDLVPKLVHGIAAT
jgi:hypothetical protein